MAGKAGCYQKEYRCESRAPRIGADAAVLNCMTDWAKASTRGRKTAGVQRPGHAETCMEPWLWTGKGIRWSSSSAITRQHGSVAALPHRLRVCRPQLSNQEACISLQKAQCAAMLDAACCDDHRSALRRHMHRVAFFGPMFSVYSQSGPYGSTRPGTPALQSRSCILHILFHWGKEHNRRFRAFLSIVQRKFSKSLTRPSPLSKENTPNHQQVTPLCSKKTPRSAAKPHSLCPKKFINSLHVPLHCPKQLSCPSKRSHWKQEKPVACPILNGFATGLLLSSSTPSDGIRLQKGTAGRVKEFTWYRSALTVN